MDIQLLSKEIVSDTYRARLQEDLDRATVCRFLVAYISDDGLDRIGRHALGRVLRDPRSFGVSSLDCSCGYLPLLGLQQQIGDLDCPRLKYFMNPMATNGDEPPEISLFHSKLVYLVLEAEQRAVIYIGSHNWSARALGPGRPRNAEASLRIEMDYSPAQLDGNGEDLGSEVNRHLLSAFTRPVCRWATSDNEPLFEQWYQKGCVSSPPTPTEEHTVLLSVLSPPVERLDSVDWSSLNKRGIYLQALDEKEGRTIWENGEKILLLVWKSIEALHEGRQPVILRCHETTHNASPNSALRGLNQSNDPIAGFAGVVLDDGQLTAAQQGHRSSRTRTHIWSGAEVEVFDFQFPTEHADCSQVDLTVRPPYQFLLTVDSIVFPQDDAVPANPELVWPRATFAVAKNKRSARYFAVPGYEVPKEVKEAILDCLVDELGVDLDSSKVLPVSGINNSKVGKRFSKHALHDTYFGPAEKQHAQEIYAKAETGILVPDLDTEEDGDTVAGYLPGPATVDREKPLARMQRVFITPIAQLEELWRATAEQHRQP